jgi:sugar/nucleoside kinase (ribokinase family)
VIVVLGRPRVHRPDPSGALAPGGLAAEIAMALGRSGLGVELVGSIGDDPEGDHVVVGLGQAGVGHAALLRDPAARTPVLGAAPAERPLPRLDAADVELGLRYLPACRVLVVADELTPAALTAALEAAA